MNDIHPSQRTTDKMGEDATNPGKYCTHIIIIYISLHVRATSDLNKTIGKKINVTPDTYSLLQIRSNEHEVNDFLRVKADIKRMKDCYKVGNVHGGFDHTNEYFGIMYFVYLRGRAGSGDNRKKYQRGPREGGVRKAGGWTSGIVGASAVGKER